MCEVCHKNIAEGFGKHTRPDKMHFCRIAKGSLYELADDLITAVDEGYLALDQCNYGRTLIEDALKSTNGYIGYLNSRQKSSWT